MNRAMAANQIQSGGIIRRLDYAHDLEALGDLLDLAFQDEITSSSMQVRNEYRTLAMLMRFFHWIFVLPLFHDAFSGVVWIESGKLVGNVTLSSINFNPRQWMISNVATHPLYRRRYIAYQLLQAAIAEAKERGAELIMLDVRQQNSGAVKLYEKLGFEQLSTRIEMRLPLGSSSRALVMPAAQNLVFRPWRPADLKASLALQQATSQAQNRALKTDGMPGMAIQLPVKALSRVLELLAGHIRQHYVVEHDGQVWALLTIERNPLSRQHTLNFVIAPAAEGQIEDWLVGRALLEIERSPGYTLTTTIASGNRYLQDALQQRGFREIVTLQRMVLQANRDAGTKN